MNETGKKAITGIKWTLIQTIIIGLIGPLTIIIQARYLTPKEMGYIAIIMIVIGLLNVIENMGMSQAIIQSDNFNNKVFTSLFAVNIIFSLIIGFVLFYTSPMIERIYNLEGLSYYLRLILILAIIQSPSLVLRAVMQKELLIKPLSIIDMLKGLVQITSMIIMFLLDFGITSVIYSTILGTLIGTIIVIGYCFNNNLVRFTEFETIGNIIPFLKFGIIISIKQIFTYIVLRVDEMLIGLMLTPDALGFYHFAKNVLERFRNLLTSSFSRVLFPYFSKLQSNLLNLKNSYNKVTEILALVAFPVFTGVALTAHLFIPIIFGEEWIESLNIFRIISLGLIPMLLTFSVATSLLYSINKPGIVLKVDIITNSIYLVIIYLLAHKGVIVIALIYVGFIIVKSLYLQVHVNHSLKGKYREYFNNLITPFINTLIMSTILLVYYNQVSLSSNVWMLITTIVIGIISYVVLTRIMNKGLYFQILNVVLKRK